MGVARFKWGDIELEFHGDMLVEPGVSVPLTKDEPPPSAYESALKRMAKRA